MAVRVDLGFDDPDLDDWHADCGVSMGPLSMRVVRLRAVRGAVKRQHNRYLPAAGGRAKLVVPVAFGVLVLRLIGAASL